ncbi:glycoside hydrolase family 9 protein [Almyronema epifaneia]|uniref:Endoglucanase n=1 Tax=Almyronema epifaneia S1 TaxID=2991925 RepID=A0ABW6IIA4_9CYAN
MNKVEFNLLNDWGTGFTAEIIITNTGTQAIDQWQVAFEAPFTIAHLWNGNLNQTGNTYSVSNLSWNRSIAPGESVRFGFNGQKPEGSSNQPTRLRLLEADPPIVASPTPPPPPTVTISDATATEGSNLNFTVSLSQASATPVTLDYTTENGSAQASQDFQPTGGQLTFAPGETQKTISVPTVDDTQVEPSETLTLKLSNASGARLTDNQGSGSIVDNDVAAIPAPVPPPVAPPPPTPLPPPANSGTGAFNYGEALQKSFLFYEAQRSGALPADHRIEWRGDSALADGAAVGVDLTGGYYDAGDHVKFGLPMAASMTLLSWGVQAYGDAYSQMGQLDEALAAIKWGTDYLLKAHVTDSQGTQAFWGQVGDGNVDHSYWGAPEEMTMPRPAFKIDRDHPGSDLAAEAAAALAAASIVFRPSDAAYADELLQNAEQLYTFADTYRGSYSNSIPNSAQFYNSWSGYQDELAWGAIWLHEALEASGQSDVTYLNKAESAYTSIGPGWTQSWDNKSYGTAVMLAQETGAARYRNQVETWLNSWLPGGSVAYTEGGLAWLDQWGSLRYSANTAFLAGIYSDTVNDPGGQYSHFATQQIDYILGDNPRQFSYMVGFGESYALNPHHRAASGTTNISDPAVNDHILYGALVGGPKSASDFAYEDARTDYISNEVALDYNAAFTGALARLAGRYGGEPLSGAELNALPGIAVADGALAVAAA